MGVLEKLAKRMKFPVTLPNGEVVHIRQPTFAQELKYGALEGSAKAGFLIGTIIVEDNGQPTYMQSEGESDEAFGLRVASTTDIDFITWQAIQDAARKLMKPPSQEVLIKNSEETSTPD